MNKGLDLFYMAKDFVNIITGRDYFHLKEKLGNYFEDGKSYYIDMSGKADWKGKYVNGVPVLYVPSVNRYIFFPSMIVQYGLGCIDKYYLTNKPEYLQKIWQVYNWLRTNINKDGYYNNNFKILDNTLDYYSDNSGMTQGLVLSFLTRILNDSVFVNKLVQFNVLDAEDLMKRIYENMILPIDKNGTLLIKDDKYYFCEYCTNTDYVVLNGWIFAIFGITDYLKYIADENYDIEINAKFRIPREYGIYFSKTTATLEQSLDNYLLDDNWSYYDNKQRLASATYQDLHIHQFDALDRLFGGDGMFYDMTQRLKKGNTLLNRTKYTLIKIKDKVKDSWSYSR